MFSFGVQRGIKNSVLLLTVLLVVCLVGILVAAFYLDRSLSQDVSEIQNAVDHRQAANIQALMVSARKVFLIITLLSISAVGFVVWGSGVLWTSHIRPLQSMVNVLGRVSNGDFEQQIQIDGSKEIQGLAQGFNHVIERAKSSLKLSGRLAGGESFEDIFDSIYDSFHRYLPYERMGIALIDHATQTIRAERAQSEVPVHLEVGYSLPLGQTSLRRVIESGVPRIIGDLELYAEKHPDSEATQLMLKEGIRSSMTMPLNINNRPMGALFFSSTSKYAYKEHH
ncbi:MAG: HAMP domain-containing protein, partial [Firmicutes bacterium]|nr:HAMP domain-containing protein [Bacillota bacterium]